MDCQSCGACCSYFTVELLREKEDFEKVPERLTRKRLVVFNHRDTEMIRDKNERCIALRGEIGKHTACSIYPQRPFACSDFDPVLDREKCNKARAKFGLPPG